MKFFLEAFAAVVFPITFLLTLPVEYPLWRAYKKEGYNVPSYVKFFWYRCMVMKEQHYVKVKEVEVTATGGNECPKCGQDGGLFKYDDCYICENCCERMSFAEYDQLTNKETE